MSKRLRADRSAHAHVAADAAAMPVATDDLRARILGASVALIDEQGLGALSMREVARRAGVSHQAPYHHFDDRAAILAALAEEGFSELRKRMRDVQVSNPGTVIDLLEEIGNAYVRFALAYPAHFRIMFRPELVDVDKYPICQGLADDTFRELVSVVMQYVEAGKGWHGKEPALISLCWSLSHGLANLLLDGPLRMKQADAIGDEHVRDVMRAFRVMMEAALPLGAQAV